MIIVVSGPGGVGKGTVVRHLVANDQRLALSRSWTTRTPRPGEDPEAYVFVDRPTFEARIADGGFLEWAEFLGDLYGTPMPEVGPDGCLADGRDLLLEIDVQGAAQVAARHPGALRILIVAPSPEAQKARLEGRGDPAEQVARRLAHADAEVAAARDLGAITIVNDDLDTAVAELGDVIASARSQHTGS
jgi:guanylate kinase